MHLDNQLRSVNLPLGWDIPEPAVLTDNLPPLNEKMGFERLINISVTKNNPDNTNVANAFLGGLNCNSPQTAQDVQASEVIIKRV